MCFTFKKNNKQTKKPVNCFLQDDASAGIQSLQTSIVRWPTRVNAIKNGLPQTKKIGCKQKRSDGNKKDRIQTKKIGCKQKR